MLSSGQDFDKKFLDLKHVLKVYFKPLRKNQKFWFLPIPSKLASLKNDHLSKNIWFSHLYVLVRTQKIALKSCILYGPGQLAQNQPKYHILFNKKAHRATYIERLCFCPTLSWIGSVNLADSTLLSWFLTFLCEVKQSVMNFCFSNWKEWTFAFQIEKSCFFTYQTHAQISLEL